MRAQAMIEIVASRDGRVPAELVCTAYRASVRGPIVLVLNGVCWQDVDRALDGLVVLLPLDIPGIVYVDVADEAAVLSAARETEKIWGVTQRFRRIVGQLSLGLDPAQAAQC